MPTTYDEPSAATATPSDTSLPLPPQVVSESSAWACAFAAAKATHSNATPINRNIGMAERRSAVADATNFIFLIEVWFFMVNSKMLFNVGVSNCSVDAEPFVRLISRRIFLCGREQADPAFDLR